MGEARSVPSVGGGWHLILPGTAGSFFRHLKVSGGRGRSSRPGESRPQPLLYWGGGVIQRPGYPPTGIRHWSVGGPHLRPCRSAPATTVP